MQRGLDPDLPVTTPFAESIVEDAVLARPEAMDYFGYQSAIEPGIVGLRFNSTAEGR